MTSVLPEPGKRAEAEGYYEQALELAGRLGDKVSGPELADLYPGYGKQLRDWGQLDKALEYLEKAFSYRQPRPDK